jgi:tetratricopeptide (TPR) repeat protein
MVKQIFKKIGFVAVGIIAGIALLEIVLRLGGFAVMQWQDHRNRRALAHGGEYRILCLGDSVTAGSYPAILEDLLNRTGGATRFTVIDRGRPGIGTGYIAATLRANLDRYKPHMVIVMMGTNYFYSNSLPYETNLLQAYAGTLRVYRFFLLVKEQLLQKAVLRRGLTAAAVADGSDRGRAAARAAEAAYAAGQLEKTIVHCRAALAAGYRGEEVYMCLARSHFFREEYAAAEAATRAGLAVRPSVLLYEQLGYIYVAQDNFAAAEAAFRDALRCKGDSQSTLVSLSHLYLQKGRPEAAEQLLQQAWQRNSLNERILGALAISYLNQRKTKEAEDCFRTAEAIRLRYYDPRVKEDYLSLVRAVRARGIKLVCMQYPMRSVRPLQKLLGSYAGGVIFVDNEAVFKQALARSSFGTLFRDQFGGDFGHLTLAGAKLLAGNAAQVVWREYGTK